MPAARLGRPRGEKPWSDALRLAAYRAAEDGDGKLLDQIARRTVAMALEGDMGAIRELGERLDGKAHQTTESAVDLKTSYVIETPAVAPTAEDWQAKQGTGRLLQ